MPENYILFKVLSGMGFTVFSIVIGYIIRLINENTKLISFERREREAANVLIHEKISSTGLLLNKEIEIQKTEVSSNRTLLASLQTDIGWIKNSVIRIENTLNGRSNAENRK